MGIVLAGLLAGSAGATEQITLVGNGKPTATIVVAGRATRAAQFAAAELQCHIRKISGATLPIVGDDVAIRGARVLIGESKATRALGLKSADFQSQEYLIRFLPETLVLIGRDREDYGKIDYEKGSGLLIYFDDHATVHAVHDFLERHCGVRWYLPTDIGLVCPSKRTLTVRGADVRRSPAMAWRTYRYMYPNKKKATRALWGDTIHGQKYGPVLSMRDRVLWEHRMRLGGERYKAHHAFYGYHARFFKDHPDWFAQGYPGRKKPPQMCYTNTEFIRQVIRDARDYFDGKGKKPGAVAEGDYFGLGALDNRLWCKCAACQAKIRTKTDKQFSNGSASDYWWAFVNEVAREIKKSHPDKFISSLAYADYALYPSEFKVESNVAVSMCLHANSWWCPAMERSDMRLFNNWTRDRGRRLYLYLYYEFPWGGAVSRQFRCFPGFSMHTIARQMKMFHEHGVRGFYYVPALMADWHPNPLMDQLNTYLFLKLADNADLDVDAMLDEFFTRYYGAAAEPMKALTLKIEEIYSNPANYPKEVRDGDRTFHQTEEMAWEWLGTEARMAEFDKLMRQARNAAETDIEKQRVALFEDGVWNYMKAGRQLYIQHKKNRAQAMPAARVPRCEDPAPDGDPTKVDWSKTGALGFRTKMGDACPRKLAVRLLHDRRYLYVQFEETGLGGKKLISRDTVWHGDDWEIFFAKQRDRPYRQIGIGPTGEHVGIHYPESGSTFFNPAASVASESTPDRWTVRMAVPLKNIVPGGWQPGEKLYMNFARVGADKVFHVWSPTFESGLHMPGKFGEVLLVEDTEIASDWWWVPGRKCVAAYQAVGAESREASTINLATPGVKNLKLVGKPPGWSAKKGWTFNAADGSYFDTGIAPRSGYTIIVRIANSSGGGIPMGVDSPPHCDMVVQPAEDKIYWRYGDTTKSSRPGLRSGVLALAGPFAYRDGVSAVDTGGKWSRGGKAITIFMGARNKSGKPLNFLNGDILAAAIYADTLTGDEVAALTRRMKALTGSARE